MIITAADHQRIVAGVHGIVDQPADARAGEHDLGEDRAGDHVADPYAEHDDRRDDRELQRVAEGDRALAQAEGARQSDVVLAHHLEHRGAHEAREVADPAQPDRERRQDEMAELVERLAGVAGADRRKPAQRDGEDEQAVDRHHERRHGDKAHRKHADETIGERAALHRGKAAERDAEQPPTSRCWRGPGSR